MFLVSVVSWLMLVKEILCQSLGLESSSSKALGRLHDPEWLVLPAVIIIGQD